MILYDFIETIIQEIERIFKRDKTYKKRARRNAALFFCSEPPQARKPFFKRANAPAIFLEPARNRDRHSPAERVALSGIHRVRLPSTVEEAATVRAALESDSNVAVA